jgi:hypothetical protein
LLEVTTAPLIAPFFRDPVDTQCQTTLGAELGPKRLEMLRELLPAGCNRRPLSNPTNANAARELREIQAATQVLGVRLLVLNAARASDLGVAFARMATKMPAPECGQRKRSGRCLCAHIPARCRRTFDGGRPFWSAART